MPPYNPLVKMLHDIGLLQEQMRKVQSYEIGPTITDYAGTFSALHGLRGLWYPGSVDNLGGVADQSGQGRALTLVGNPLLTLNPTTTPPVLFPYYALDGTGDHFLRPDEAGLDVLGTETYIASASRGLTVGGWFKSSTMTGNEGLITKYTTAGNQKSWALLLATAQADFTISSTGANNFSVLSTNLTANTWYFIVGRFAPSAEIALFINDTKFVNTTTIPAALFNSNAGLIVGGYDAGANLLTGGWAMSFLCAAYLPDYMLSYLFFRTRGMFGV